MGTSPEMNDWTFEMCHLHIAHCSGKGLGDSNENEFYQWKTVFLATNMFVSAFQSFSPKVGPIRTHITGTYIWHHLAIQRRFDDVIKM